MGGGGWGRGGNGREGLRGCVYVCVGVRVYASVDAGEGEGQSEICNAFLN